MAILGSPTHRAEQHAALQPPRVRGEARDRRQVRRGRGLDQNAGARQRIHKLLKRPAHGRDVAEGGSANTVTVEPETACSSAAGQV